MGLALADGTRVGFDVGAGTGVLRAPRIGVGEGFRGVVGGGFRDRAGSAAGLRRCL
ncbi:MAG TPA: hypothetical protein VES42_08875 [Pilimelia sp.]|nr:hypothetical protein [Pilimelia sp.]